MAIGALGAGCTPSRQTMATLAHVPRFESAPCWSTIPANVFARCGFLVVPENRAARNGRTIRVAVAIVRAVAKNPAPTPLVYLDGGPGGAPILSASLPVDEHLNADRDLILVDQRGTYYSQPQLTCPVLDRFFSRLLGLVYDAASTRREHVAATSACRAQLIASGIDLAAYNTMENAADFADLRRTLGYKQWNVYGISYGTNLALNLMRIDPSGIRSVVLDSTEPPNLVALPAFWPQAAHGFAKLFAACAAQPTCGRTQRDLEANFARLVVKLESRPVTANVLDPISHRGVKVTTDGGALANWLVGMSFATAQFKDVPLWIGQLAGGKLQSIAASRAASVTPPGLIGYGLTFGVICSEWYPFARYSEILTEGRRALPGYPSSVLREPPQFTFVTDDCRIWNVPKAPARVRETVRSTIATLILSGSFDAVTASPWAKAAATMLANSRLLVFPGVGHGVAPASACAQAVVRSFLMQPHAPNVRCVASVKPPVFTSPDFARNLGGRFTSSLGLLEREQRQPAGSLCAAGSRNVHSRLCLRSSGDRHRSCRQGS
jgi:pimeloyl-ACP methyl ester carboxylesterase